MADIFGQVPLEAQPELQAINRQQELSKMLLQQGMQQPQGQMVSGHYVAPSLLQHLQPLFGAYAGSKGMETAEKQQLELAKTLRQQKGEAISEFQKLMSDPLTRGQAMQFAAKNQYLQPMAAELMKPQKLGEGENLVMPSISGGEPINLAGGGEKKTELIRDYNQAVSSGAFKGNIVDFDLQRRNASAARTSLNVQNQLPFKEQIQKEAASGLMKNFETLQNVPSALANMDKMVSLSKQPIYAGVGGETKLQIAKLFNNNFGTNISPETVKNTEEFKSAAYMGIMDNLKKTDSNPTMAQQNALKEAIGSLGTDPAAIPRVVNVMRDVLINKAMQHNSLVQQTMQNGVQYPYSIEVPLPKAAPVPSGNVRSLADEILGRKPQ